MKKIKYLLLVAIMTVMAFMFTGCGSTKVDLNKYITIEAEGYNAIGTANYSFDYEQFYEDYNAKIKISDEAGLKEQGYNIEDSSAKMMMDICVSMELDENAELSNGDTVTLTWNCEDELASEYFNCELSYSNMEYTVEGLKDAKTFDPFEYLEISFEDIAPFGRMVLTPDYSKNEIQYIRFMPDKPSELSNGDVVTVTASLTCDENEFVDKFGSVLSVTTKEYTVDSLQEYATDVSQISSESMEKMDKQAQDVFRAYVARNWDKPETLNSVTYLGNYFLTSKNEIGSPYKNYLYLIYKVSATIPDRNESIDYYFYIYYTDLAVLPDGTCTIDLTSYNSIMEAFYKYGYRYLGYEDLNALYNEQIVGKINEYEFTTNIKE